MELNEVESKRNNIVVFGILESDSAPGRSSPKEKDRQEIDSIFEALASKGVQSEIKFRIGKKEAGKVRPVVVRLKEANDKETIFWGSSQLKEHRQWKEVYVKQDLTKSQRDLMKKQEEDLKSEAARRNALLNNGEGWEWKVRGRGLQRHLARVHFTD